MFPFSAAAILLAASCLIMSNELKGQQRLAIKNGESVELHPVYYVSHCHSIMLGRPEIEVLEGPPELTFSIREEPVLPRRQGCAANVPGGMLLLMAKGVTEKMEAKLTYRVKYSTKDGPRQTSSAYIVSVAAIVFNPKTSPYRDVYLRRSAWGQPQSRPTAAMSQCCPNRASSLT